MSTIQEKVIKWIPLNYQRIPYTLRNFVTKFLPLPDEKEPEINKITISLPIKKVVVLLTHDVDTLWGYENGIHILRDIEEEFGFNSCYNFIARSKEYKLKKADIDFLIEEGCEIGSHGLLHDGKLATITPAEQLRRIKISKKILEKELEVNIYGFRSPWLAFFKDLFPILELAGYKYDMSCCGLKTIFPYYPENYSIVEFPLTVPQDYYLLNYKKKTNQEFLKFWLRRLYEIKTRKGLVVINAHPDKYDLGGKPILYRKFLESIYADADNFQVMLPNQLYKSIEDQQNN